MLTKIMKFRNYVSINVAGIGGISQSVAGHLVAKCGDPNLTDAEFDNLVRYAQDKGYELTPVGV